MADYTGDLYDDFLTQYPDDETVNQEQILQNTVLQVERVLIKGWEPMPLGVHYLERRIFSINPYNNALGTAESAAVLVEAFRLSMDPADSSDDILALSHAEIEAHIFKSSRLTILEVVRVQNMQRSMLSNAFAKTYSLEDENTKPMYHGTDPANARIISSQGFRGACSSRSKFGKGIYVSNNVWQAMSYAPVDRSDGSQTLLVVKLLQGPTVVGTEGLGDFGTDAAGKQILTTTDPSGTIFCASFSAQLLATYRIRMRFDTSAMFTEAQTNLIVFFPPEIWQKHREHVRAHMMATNNTAGLAKANRPAPTPSAPAVYLQLDTHAGISVGERVVVQNSWFLHKFCDGKEGYVRAIIKDNKVMFCVEVVDVPGIAARIEAANVKGKKPIYPGVNMGYVRCITNQIMRAQVPVVVPFSTAP